MKFIKKTLTLCAVLALTLCASAQVTQTSPGASATYYIAQPDPFAAIFDKITNAGALYVTNVSAGWTNTTYTTNVVQTWNPTNVSFTYTTNVTTNNALTYDVFPAKGQNFIPIEWDYSVGTPSNVWIEVVRSVSGSYFVTDTNVLLLTNAASVVGTNTAIFVVPMQGYNFAKIADYGWIDNLSGHVLTNLGVFSSTKPN